MEYTLIKLIIYKQKNTREKCITDVQSYRRPDAGSYHFLVGIKIRQGVLRERHRRNQNRSKRIRQRNEREKMFYRTKRNERSELFAIG